MRVAQPKGARGSLKWIQRAVNDRPLALEAPLDAQLGTVGDYRWLSPRVDDDFAEYRDTAFLERIDAGQLAPALSAFWPRRGPQWDALALRNGEVLLVEAKAHVAEMLSPPSAAVGDSLTRIEAALADTAAALNAMPLVPWHRAFYQLANRLAMLHFLTQQGIAARLLLVGFVGDDEMGGPSTAEAWSAAYQVADHVMGLKRRHGLAGRIHHIHPDIGQLMPGVVA